MDLTQPVLLTAQGLTKLEHELEQLTERRVAAASELKDALQPGDVEDNPEYEQAKETLGRINDRIYELQEMIGRAQIIESTGSAEAGPGSTVVVVDEDNEKITYYLVGAIEADPGSGQLSIESPVGRALVGRRSGERITVEVPAGRVELLIKEVR
ncbi:MAG: GreA/GreB family elongation factor [Candidatus Dormibacteraceae bacterium]